MPGNKKFNSDLDITGKIKVTNVPNRAGTVMTYDTTSKEISTRTHSEIISDLDLITATNIAAAYLKLAGGTMTGPLNFKNGTWNNVGDDVAIGDINVAGQLGIKALNTANPGIAFYNNSAVAVGNLISNAGTLQWSGNTVWHSGNFNPDNYVTTNTTQTITGTKTFDSIINFSNNVGGIQGTIGDNDYWRIIGRSSSSNAGYLEIATADDGNEPIIVSQYFGVFSNLARRAYLLDESGNTSFPGTVTALDFIGTSDFNLKENIETYDEKPLNTEYRSFNFKNDDTPRIGLIAQELEQHHPEFVRTDMNGVKSISYIDLHSAEIAYLKEENKKLKEELNLIKKHLGL